MKYKRVIFDLDGTIVSSIDDIGNSLNRILEKYKLPLLTIQEYTDRIGQGLHQLVIDSTPENTDSQLIEKIFLEFVEDYGNNYNIETKPYDGVTEMLQELIENGVKLGVNSNKKHEFTVDIINTLFPEIPFVLVLGDRVNVNKKPDPTSAIEIIEAMNLGKDEVIYVGDTDHDMHTANNAGIDSIGVSWGYRSLDLLKAEGATHTVNNIKDIVSVVID